MPKKQLTVAILCGGRSAEHEVSLISAKHVLLAANKKKYSFLVIGIDHEGKWYLYDTDDFLAGLESVGSARLPQGKGDEIAWLLGQQEGASIIRLANPKQRVKVDIVFPLLHGPHGEDGTVQGLLRLADLAFVGADVLGSAVCMDKGVSKRLLQEAGIPVAKFLEIHDNEPVTFEQARKAVGTPMFVKPANLGSSVGVSKVSSAAEFVPALSHAFAYDTKVLIEEAIVGQEVECSVLGNELPAASVVGEVIAHDEFYTYQAKYIDENGAELIIPAKLAPAQTRTVRELALRAYRVLECEGMARVDFFVSHKGKVLVNEVNTIPGFTPISMYPMLWEAAGIPSTELIDQLIGLAIDRQKRRRHIKIRAVEDPK